MPTTYDESEVQTTNERYPYPQTELYPAYTAKSGIEPLMEDKQQFFLASPLLGEFVQARKAIVEALQRIDVEPVLTDFSRRIPSDMLQQILKTASFVVADVTGANPYVIYEIGFAHGIQKPVMLVTQDLDLVPDFLKQDYFLVVYKVGDLARLQKAVISWTRRLTT
jgi:hypothetical protein